MGIATNHWLVIFTEPAQRFAIHRWLRLPEGFAHCAAMGFSPFAEAWTFLDWRAHELEAYSFTPAGIDAIWRHLADTGATVVAYWPKGEPRGWRWRSALPALTCVEALKHLLRIQAASIWTPRGLYLWLLKNGGTPLMVRGGEAADMGKVDGLSVR